MATYKLEAIKILKKYKKPLNSNEITKEIIKRGKVEIRGITPNATLSSILSADIKKKGSKSIFIKTEEGFKLR
jgi:hypothetical protein